MKAFSIGLSSSCAVGFLLQSLVGTPSVQVNAADNEQARTKRFRRGLINVQKQQADKKYRLTNEFGEGDRDLLQEEEMERMMQEDMSFPAAGGGSDDFTCGSVCNFKPQDYTILAFCLSGRFENRTVNGHQKLALSLKACDDDGFYARARRTCYGVRNPAAIIFAENTQDVVDAVNCAREAGYKVSPRGRGHSYDGWGAADGAVVIDMQYTCNVEEMVASIDRTKTGDHLIPGTKYIGTIKTASGCCNANWLAGVYLGFDASEGAMASIGSCPSVGITGYSLGGGLGDVSPLAGYGLDIISEYEMVLADGSVVIASENDHEDLYWANRGGGGGIGVITSLTWKVLQSPSPGAFTVLSAIVVAEGKLGEWWIRFQDFLYDNPESYRFGGSSTTNGNTLVFLGPAEEAVDILADGGLLDENLLDQAVPTTVINDDGSVNCDSGECAAPFPANGVLTIRQFQTNGETQAYISCNYWLTGYQPLITARSLDVCDDLGVDSSHCECIDSPGFPCYANGLTSASCSEPEVINAIVNAAADPRGFLSRHGVDVNEEGYIPFYPVQGQTQVAGGQVLPRLEAKTLQALAALGATGVDVPLGNHLAHGASHLVTADATAMPWRNAAFNIGQYSDPRILEVLLQDKTIGGDTNKLQGYYSYIGPQSWPSWEEYYFGDNVRKLKRIKAKYDPNGLFDKPMQIHGSIIDDTEYDDPADDEPMLLEEASEEESNSRDGARPSKKGRGKKL